MTLNEIQNIVIQLAKEKAEAEISVNVNSELECLLNSITYIQFLIACEDTFDIEVDDDELDMSNFRTLNDVALYIQEKVGRDE